MCHYLWIGIQAKDEVVQKSLKGSTFSLFPQTSFYVLFLSDKHCKPQDFYAEYLARIHFKFEYS